MNCRKGVAIGMVAFLVLLGSLVVSQEIMLLEQRDVERLGSEVRVLYEKAVESLDRIDPISAIEYLEQAVNLNPEVVELDFLLARLACDRARLTYGDESVKYYNIAEKALKLVQEQKNLNGEILQRTAKNLEIVERERRGIAERDARRYTFGAKFMAARAKMLLPKTGATPTPTPTGPTGALPGTGLESIPGLGTTPGLGIPSSSVPSPSGTLPSLPSFPGTPAPTPQVAAPGEIFR